ncbi:hypothetical protein [Sphingobium yanoikuyae]|uniref:Uncharacterized protein n=1 Tax=Sphingobium yanoikuyae TaxID=13690 RepID=A0A291MY88_SPHYA|nr:hypothetical protein [Sphingobium yanoikuyae]ATI79868.1 hypothetical protein A6768_07420 [Sphingobium yanoikuyae]
MGFQKNRGQLLVGVSIMAAGLLLALTIIISQIAGALPTPTLVLAALACGSLAGPLLALLFLFRRKQAKGRRTQAL